MSMKWASLPSAYRNCMRRVSVRTGRNFSPARNVLSITAPSSTRLSLVRTKAPPLPGFTCWNSTMRKTVPSTSTCIPFLNWLVLTMRAGRLAAAGPHPLRQPPLLSQLLQVRGQRQRREVPQLRRGVRPGGVEQLVARPEARLERLQQPPFARQPVRDVLVELGRGVPHVRSVPGAEHVEVEAAQAPQRVEVRRQRALARRDEHASAPEHGVAREAGPPRHQADAVGRVARGRERSERPDRLAVARQRDRRAELSRALGVVGMGVGEDDALDPLFGRAPDGLEVARVGGSGVHDPRSHHVAVRPVQRERRRIGRSDAHHAGRVALLAVDFHNRFCSGVTSAQLGSHTNIVGLGNERGTFLAALVATCLVAALDLAIQADAILVELLVVGPVIAAFGATPRDTAIAALIAFLASIPIGLASDNFGSAEHLIGIGAVGIVGSLCTGIARLRRARELDAARLTVQYGVARVLAEAESLESAAPELLEAIGAPLGWSTGNLWESRDGGPLRLVGSWTAPGVTLPRFEEATRRLDGNSERALPARVRKTGRQEWIADFSADPSYPRAEAAGRDGVGGGTAFPVRIGNEIVAVIELFARDVRGADAGLIATTDAIGTQVGEFIESLRSAEAQRLSEARKGAILASALDGVITIDHEGRVVEFNPAAERIFGRTAETAVGAELAELVIPPALRERHRAALRRCVETGESVLLGQRVELTGMRADGSEFPVELAINRIAGSDPPMFTGTLRDITARRGAEREREELLRLEQLARVDATHARDQLEAILRGVADAVTAQAPDGRLLFANEAAVELLRYESSEALLSAPLSQILDRFEIFDESGRPFPVDRLPGRRALAEGVGGEVVLRFRVRATGEERWSAVKATPIMDTTGAVGMAINVIEDITDHKRAELGQRFLSDSSAVLGSSLDTAEVLRHVASLAVPELADWCAVDVVADD